MEKEDWREGRWKAVVRTGSVKAEGAARGDRTYPRLHRR